MHFAPPLLLVLSLAAEHPQAMLAQYTFADASSSSYSSSLVAPDSPVPGASRAMNNSPVAATRQARYIGAYPSIGLSFGQTVGNLRIYSFAQDRSAQVPSILYLHPSGNFYFVRFDYMIQEIPVYVLHQPKYYDYNSVALTTQRRAVFGTGIFPVGERMVLDPTHRLQISLYANGGFTYFTRRILSEGGTRFNIGLQFGNSYQYPVTKNSSVIVGVAENHLSNSNIHDKNPGLDTILIYAQYVFRLHRSK